MTQVNWTLLADSVEKRLQEMTLAGESKQKALSALGNTLANRIRLGFRLGRSPWGTAWKPINPAFRVGQPLRDTGRLQRSITYRVEGEAVTVGTNVRYARTHQFGAKIFPKNAKNLAIPTAAGGMIFSKGVTIPDRPFMPIKGGQVSLPGPWAQSALRAMAKSMGL